MRKGRGVLWAAVAVLVVWGTGAAAETAERLTTAVDRQEVTVTIYGSDFALVKDRRQVSLDAGENRLAFADVSAGLRPETALLRSPGDPQGVRVREQNFDFAPLTPEALLERFVGRTVRVVRVHPKTGKETETEAQVLAASGGAVLRIGERIETQIPGRIVFPEVPEGLRERPTLVFDLISAVAGARDLELSYLTGGLSWRADYVAELADGGERLDLSGWITLTNRSGAAYPDARLQLVAGEVNRVGDGVAKRVDYAPRELMAAAAPDVREEGLFAYRLYTLERPTTLRENQTKQIALLEGRGIATRTEYRLAGQEYYYQGRQGQIGTLPVAIFLEFENREEGGLGRALPGGIVRVYQADAAGVSRLVGEDRIGHTPRNETVRLRLGYAFDLVADRVQTDFRRLPSPEGEGTLLESAHRIEIRNAGEKEATVTVVEPVPGDWEIVSASLPHEKLSAREALWQIPVAAGGKAVLEYRARVRF